MVVVLAVAVSVTMIGVAIVMNYMRHDAIELYNDSASRRDYWHAAFCAENKLRANATKRADAAEIRCKDAENRLLEIIKMANGNKV